MVFLLLLFFLFVFFTLRKNMQLIEVIFRELALLQGGGIKLVFLFFYFFIFFIFLL